MVSIFTVQPMWKDSSESTLTVVGLLADVVWWLVSPPGIGRVTLGTDPLIAHRQAHLVDGVEGALQTAPPQHGVPRGVTAVHGQGLGAHLQAQTLGCAHVEEPVARPPLPLGCPGGVTDPQANPWGARHQTFPFAHVLDGEGVFITYGGMFRTRLIVWYNF